MMGRWSKKTDFLTIRIPLAVFCIYLVFMQFLKQPFYSHNSWAADGTPVTSSSIYVWIQFVVCILVSTITAFYFEENFRKPSANYIGVFKLGFLRTVAVRWVYLVALMEVIYLPFVALSFYRINKGIDYAMVRFGQQYAYVDITKPLVQCAIAMVFYVTLTLFLVALFRSRVYAMIIIMTYCTLEATAIPRMIGNYAIFRGAFDLPCDFHNYILPNTVVMIIATVICCLLIFALSFRKNR